MQAGSMKTTDSLRKLFYFSRYVSLNQQTLVITQTSTLLPLPKSLNMPEQIASVTNLTPPSLYKEVAKKINGQWIMTHESTIFPQLIIRTREHFGLQEQNIIVIRCNKEWNQLGMNSNNTGIAWFCNKRALNRELICENVYTISDILARNDDHISDFLPGE